ncbi:dicer-like protein 2 [Phaeosphaeria sp. MPI-PUGE-AT-0046c]|nr:dicer-like protein 2 [Phaeosphaeria sp. MPI-PUGE-AT-0046c]
MLFAVSSEHRPPCSHVRNPAYIMRTSTLDMEDMPNGAAFRLRPYQAEMVEESMHSNIICVMDTGSGKTHIAIDRTRAELEICQSNKLVWFLAPTVTLCEQQYEVFRSNLPGYGIQLFCGKDNVDHWTEQAAWDAVLLNVRIVLSTHQVLLDALTHAFVKMSRLALLIFDEAHHCTQNHPAHRIMSEFYVQQPGEARDQLPRILGLSASPVMKADATSEALQQIEKNLCATSRTPKIHRADLLRFVHRPLLDRVDYPLETNKGSGLLESLQHAFNSYDLRKDPFMLELLSQQRQGYDVSKQIHKLSINSKTYCREQLKTLVIKAVATIEELGSSPMEWYLHQCISHFRRMVHSADSQLVDWSIDEKRHLLDILTGLSCFDSGYSLDTSISLDRISRKLDLLVDLLIREAKDDAAFTCLVFVEQRASIACIAEVLALHPGTQSLLRVGTFVGTSQSGKRKANIATFAELRNQQTTLDDFRSGTINVILATSVLEEGIDVSSCQLVICFEPPKNLKSFIQRRGRARKSDSKFIIFLPEGARPPETWELLEEEMKAAYLDELRQTARVEERELQDEDGHRFFEVPSTGALLTLDNALPHLNHFCAILGSGPYVDTRPEFEFTHMHGLINAQVMLPISVDPAVRVANSSRAWATERRAKQDAAFEAYKQLYQAGLVNNNLLPAKQDNELSEFQIPDNRPAMVEVSPTLDPWPLIARSQQQDPHVYYRTMLTVRGPESTLLPPHMVLFTPVPLPRIGEIKLFWNASTHYTIENSWLPGMILSEDEIAVLSFTTYNMMFSVFESRMATNRYDFPWLIAPCSASGEVISRNILLSWDQNSSTATDVVLQHREISEWGLVTHGDARKYMVRAVTPNSTRDDMSKHSLQVVRLPKRRDFLHPEILGLNHNDAFTKVEELSASGCLVDGMPTRYSIFALMFPSILHRFEIGIVAETLRNNVLRPLALDSMHLPLIVRALTSSVTGEDDNYQRLEFIGDCILKILATVHLMATYLTYPESYLTGKKGKVVCNGFLARATLAAGLDKFIFTKRFTGLKWSPRYTGDLLATADGVPKVQRSSKVIADVIESLIGTSYVVGGLDKAFACVQTLLPLEPWTSIPSANDILYEAAPIESGLATFGILEKLLGYSFSKRGLLLEALTHASFKGPHAHSSYQRLEFLGDAVLDYIISKRLYAHKPSLSHQKMHAIRTATVNASFLAFRMFETTVPEETTNKSTLQLESVNRALWQFLRSGSPAINVSRDIALSQHRKSRALIIAGLDNDSRFPWHLFALTDAPKFLSDIVESVIGAVYTDSHGDIPTCEVVVRRLGILDCLERILRDQVDCLHPKERLGHLAVERDVKYVRVSDETTDGASKGLYRCQVKVGGVEVGGVVGGLKKLNAETIAAWQAVGLLEGRSDVAMEDSDEDEFFDAEEDGGVMLDDSRVS